jgi:hypothetical protein
MLEREGRPSAGLIAGRTRCGPARQSQILGEAPLGQSELQEAAVVVLVGAFGLSGGE